MEQLITIYTSQHYLFLFVIISNGEVACSGNAGEIDDGSCKGKNACIAFGYDSSDPDNPVEVAGSKIGKSSCLEESSCVASYGTIGDGSCTKGGDGVGDPSCSINSGTIKDGSCTGLGSCQANSGTIGDGSWYVYFIKIMISISYVIISYHSFYTSLL